MNGKYLPHIVAIAAFAVFIVLGLACASQPAEQPQPTQTQPAPVVTGDVMNKEGRISQASLVPEKNFNGIGLIFVESAAIIDSRGNVIEGSKITHEMLMREAQKLGADDIINLKIDERISALSAEERTKPEYRGARRYEFKANALAIKYTN